MLSAIHVRHVDRADAFGSPERQGAIDPFACEEDARAGVAKLEKELHLFRNIEPIHWLITVPSVRDPATGAWRGGDLDAARPKDIRAHADFGKWQMGEPSLKLQFPPNTIEPQSANQIMRTVVEAGAASGRAVRGVEFMRSDRRVVRAAFFTVQETNGSEAGHLVRLDEPTERDGLSVTPRGAYRCRDPRQKRERANRRTRNIGLVLQRSVCSRINR